ncbi:MAG: isoleucine--tRNA ligase, partial [Microbacterium sp.]|nr:isoleucine--tRNA ligase [Microbacterium sp.]
IQAARAGDWHEVDGTVVAGGIPLEDGEYELVLETTGRPEGEALAIVPSGGFVLLDTRTTPELEAEGLARDAIRVVQEARKNAGLDVSDRIVLALNAAPAEAPALEAHAELIAAETLAVAFAVQSTDELDRLVDEVTSPGDGVHRSGAKALGAGKAPLIVTIDTNLERVGA